MAGHSIDHSRVRRRGHARSYSSGISLGSIRGTGEVVEEDPECSAEPALT